jgi:hypothetical protein
LYELCGQVVVVHKASKFLRNCGVHTRYVNGVVRETHRLAFCAVA